MAESVVIPLTAVQARKDYAPDSFEMTPDSAPVQLQQRAVEAIRFGTAAGPDFHMIAVGSNLVGMEEYIGSLLRQSAGDMPPCCDWCYVMNFQNPNAPRAIRLPAGRGREFKSDVEHTINELREDVPRAFETEPYENQRNAILEGFSAERDAAFEALQQRASELGFTLIQTPAGLNIAPVLAGQPVSPEAYAQLEPAIKERFEAGRGELSSDLDRTMRTVRELEYRIRETIRELDRNIANEIIGQRFTQLEETYNEFESIVAYFDAMKSDILNNIMLFRGQPGQNMPMPQPGGPAAAIVTAEEFLRRYEVNLLVDHAGEEHAVVVTEENPTHPNLIGKIERRGVLGTLVTDFTMIKPGALLRANDGYLILHLDDLLTAPFAWEALKQALNRKTVRIEEIGQLAGTVITTSLEPEPIPLDVKIVLLADPYLASIVAENDPEFGRLFKIHCEFQRTVEDTGEHIQALASYLISVEDEDRPPLDATGVAALLGHAGRMADDQRRLSVELYPLRDLALESRQVAASEGKETTDGAAVHQAIALAEKRSSYTSERLNDMLVDGTIMVDTDGAVTGQINGLSVMMTSNYAFGKPVRITARTFAGRDGVVDIDREVELGGPIHSKGVMILSGYLGGMYGQQQPVSMSSSIVFEQSYSGVEGDSASLAELCALLSSLADLPIRQNLAVTGSINQRGQVQAIGGINEKIEGFFDLVQERGLDTKNGHGVVFPHTNTVNLSLKTEVIDAIANGEFFLYPVSTVDEAITLFTGVEAGEPDDEGNYPPESVHGRVMAQLSEYAEAAKSQQDDADE